MASENKDRMDSTRMSQYEHFAFITMEGVDAALGPMIGELKCKEDAG